MEYPLSLHITWWWLNEERGRSELLNDHSSDVLVEVHLSSNWEVKFLQHIDIVLVFYCDKAIVTIFVLLARTCSLIIKGRELGQINVSCLLLQRYNCILIELKVESGRTNAIFLFLCEVLYHKYNIILIVSVYSVSILIFLFNCLIGSSHNFSGLN